MAQVVIPDGSSRFLAFLYDYIVKHIKGTVPFLNVFYFHTMIKKEGGLQCWREGLLWQVTYGLVSEAGKEGKGEKTTNK